MDGFQVPTMNVEEYKKRKEELLNQLQKLSPKSYTAEKIISVGLIAFSIFIILLIIVII